MRRHRGGGAHPAADGPGHGRFLGSPARGTGQGLPTGTSAPPGLDGVSALVKPASNLPLAASLPRAGGLAGAEDRRALDATRPVHDTDKVATLRAYRRATGLCFTCGERWGRDHRCPA